jgi:Ca2+-binding EF-hand superfamily protein
MGIIQSKEEISRTFKALDSDNNGTIDINEWKQATMGCSKDSHSISEAKLK